MTVNLVDTPDSIVSKRNPEQYLDTLKIHLEKVLKQVDAHTEWYKERAKRNRTKYYFIRIPIIIFGIILPQISAFQIIVQNTVSLAIAVFVIASLIAILTALDTFFRYGETWIEEKNAQLALYALLRKYKRERLKIDSVTSVEDSIDMAEKIIDALRIEYEQIVGETINSFVKRTEDTTSIFSGLRVT